MIILKIWNALFSQDLNALRLLDRYSRGCSVSDYRMVVRPYRTTIDLSVGRAVRSCHELSWGNVFIEGNTLIWIVRKSEFKVLNYVKNLITVVPVSLFYLNLTDSIFGRLIKSFIIWNTVFLCVRKFCIMQTLGPEADKFNFRTRVVQPQYSKPDISEPGSSMSFIH